MRGQKDAVPGGRWHPQDAWMARVVPPVDILRLQFSNVDLFFFLLY
jgi:hypothetical protein